MEELYWFNCYKDDKKAGKGKTWTEILQYIYEELNSTVQKRNKYGWREDIKAYTPAKINNYFSGWKHSQSEGEWIHGHWEEKVIRAYWDIIVGPLQPYKSREITVRITERVWIPRHFVPSTGTFLTDSYGRVIPSGYVKACYLRFKPDTSVKYKTYPYWYFNTWRGTGRGHVNCGRKYAGNHGNSVREIKHRPGYEQLQKETRDEYGITFNLNRRTLVDLDACCYHFNHRSSNKGHGWKRTRKAKQWM